jgi:hypothetical protein
MKVLIKILLAIVSTALCGCPVPYIYVALDGKNASVQQIEVASPEFKVKIFSIHPFLDNGRNVITMDSRIVNLSTRGLVFDLRNSVIYSDNDTFRTKNFEGELINKFKNNQYDITIQPYDTLNAGFYFFSDKSYNRKEFRQEVLRQPMVLKLNLFGQKDTVINFILKKINNK